MNNTMHKLHDEPLWMNGELSPDTLVLDVRTPAEFREAHIPGSTNVPLGDLRRRAATLLGPEAPKCVALVCRTGQRAAAACEQLKRQGHADVHVLEGGLASWLEAGLPVDRGRKGVSLERQVRIAAGALVVLGVLLGFLVHAAFFGLAGFVGAGLVFAGVTDTCGMAMVIARMPWNRAPVACERN